ncbi:hypothetical protein C8Q75DRAFT_811660 [Abortiporus biennis]|nr:hypothetical protein C8Q75DRAFT_811660 [Abortiporus biennis]
MPGPVVYVAVVIGTVAAALAFHEFIYEPHIAPKVEAWAESFVERRRRLRENRNGPIAVPVQEFPMDENQARRDERGTEVQASGDDSDRMSVELENLVAREVNEWRSNIPRSGTLRQRNNAGVMEESNVFIPYHPLSPTQVTTDYSGSSAVSQSSRSPRSTPRSPAPREIHTSEMRQTSKSDTPVFVSPRPLTPVSNVSRTYSPPISPNDQLNRSVSSTSSFTPAVLGPQSPTSMVGSTHSEHFSDARSALAVDSQPPSRAMSPFSDIHAASTATYNNSSAVTSPFILSPSIGSDFELPSDGEEAVLSPSLRSGMFSPSLVNAEDPFEVGSVQGSDDVSSWASVDGRRTPPEF